MHAVSSALKTLCARLFFTGTLALTCVPMGLLSFTAAHAGPSRAPSFSQAPAYAVPKVPVFHPPKIPAFRPPQFHPPRPHPRRSHLPQPKFHAPKPAPLHFGFRNPDPSTRVVYLPGPTPFIPVTKPHAPVKTVKKAKTVYRYQVQEVHQGLCATHFKSLVYAKPSAAIDPLGKVATGTKLHIKQCLLTRDGAAHWCSFGAAPHKTAWIPAKFLASCPPW